MARTPRCHWRTERAEGVLSRSGADTAAAGNERDGLRSAHCTRSATPSDEVSNRHRRRVASSHPKQTQFSSSRSLLIAKRYKFQRRPLASCIRWPVRESGQTGRTRPLGRGGSVPANGWWPPTNSNGRVGFLVSHCTMHSAFLTRRRRERPILALHVASVSLSFSPILLSLYRSVTRLACCGTSGGTRNLRVFGYSSSLGQRASTPSTRRSVE